MTSTAQRTCYRHPDRVTGLSCSECGRPICTECMTMAPVGIRCPEHSGRAQGVQRVTRGVQRASFEGGGAKVTKALIAVNVGVYVAEMIQGAGVNGTRGSIYTNGVLWLPFVAKLLANRSEEATTPGMVCCNCTQLRPFKGKSVMVAPLIPVPLVELHGVAANVWFPNTAGVHVKLKGAAESVFMSAPSL